VATLENQLLMMLNTTVAADGWAKRTRSASRRSKRNRRRERGNSSAHPVKSARSAQRLCPREQPQGGLGNALLRKLCADADIAGNALFLMPDGGDDAETARLERWYATHGFERIQGDP
jgi:hypothetical protein